MSEYLMLVQHVWCLLHSLSIKLHSSAQIIQLHSILYLCRSFILISCLLMMKVWFWLVFFEDTLDADTRISSFLMMINNENELRVNRRMKMKWEKRRLHPVQVHGRRRQTESKEVPNLMASRERFFLMISLPSSLFSLVYLFAQET